MTIKADVYITRADQSAPGLWFSLLDYTNPADFWEDVLTKLGILGQDVTPELEILETQGHSILDHFIGQYDIDEVIFYLLNEYDDIDNLELINAYFTAKGLSKNDDLLELANHALDNYAGCYESLADFAQSHLECDGMLDNIPDIIKNNLDYEGIALELLHNQGLHTKHKKHYFYNY